MDPVIDIRIYRTFRGKVPFSLWLHKLDRTTQAVIDTRIARIRKGNFGDCKHLSGCQGLFELRIDFGSGYRIYYGIHKKIVVILLCGGDKRSQERDIHKAKEYWKDFLTNASIGE